jgi:hypothetical protein
MVAAAAELQACKLAQLQTRGTGVATAAATAKREGLRSGGRPTGVMQRLAGERPGAAILAVAAGVHGREAREGERDWLRWMARSSSENKEAWSRRRERNREKKRAIDDRV